LPIAVVEVKDDNHPVGSGMQQALAYAEALDVPFVFSSNGDAFIFHDRVNSLIETKRAELIRLCAQYHVRRLELCGSATGAHFDPDTSDLDFLVEFQDLSPREHTDAFFGFMEELQQIFGRPVELVAWRAIRNPYFLQAVEQTCMLLYATA
jgi:predicted nucleotidyltransferase